MITLHLAEGTVSFYLPKYVDCSPLRPITPRNCPCLPVGDVWSRGHSFHQGLNAAGWLTAFQTVGTKDAACPIQHSRRAFGRWVFLVRHTTSRFNRLVLIQGLTARCHCSATSLCQRDSGDAFIVCRNIRRRWTRGNWMSDGPRCVLKTLCSCCETFNDIHQGVLLRTGDPLAQMSTY